LIFGIIATNGFSHNFGKDEGFTVGLIFLPFVFFPVLAFGNASYIAEKGSYQTAENDHSFLYTTCILGWLATAFVLIFNVFVYFDTRDTLNYLSAYEPDDSYYSYYNYYNEPVYYENLMTAAMLNGAISIILIAGMVMIWKLQKTGFFLFASSALIMIGIPVFLTGLERDYSQMLFGLAMVYSIIFIPLFYFNIRKLR